MRKLKLNRQAFIDWIYIIFGTFLTGFGISVFMNPARLAPGGVSGLGTIIYHVIEDKTGKTMELGLIILFLSIPIYLLGLAVFGKEYGIRTLMGTLLLSLSTFIFDSIFPNGIIDYSKESSLWLCTLFTGLTNGIGIGLVMRTGSNTGGTDIIAQILARYTPLGMGNALLFVDGTVILSSIFIFGIENALYSAVVSIIISLIIDRVIVPFGTNYAKTVYIISPHIDIIGEYILKNMNRSGTIIPSRGLFSGENKEMLMTVIPKKDLTKLTRCVKEADPNAFLVIQDTYHVLGEGYQPLDVIADSKDVSQS
ncbi:MAG: YitT family protein [Candidatus Ornithospirochaeta sp.]